MADLKLCKDCRWFGENAWCQHPAAVKLPDPVFGHPRVWCCAAFRVGNGEGGYCGESAQYFEPAEVKEAAE